MKSGYQRLGHNILPFVASRHALALGTLAFFMAGCSMGGSGGSGGSGAEKPIAAYCPHLPSETFAAQSPITITGTAKYEYRTLGNGAVATPEPIRFAEVRVTDSAGSIVQCAETDGGGSFSFALPGDGASYTVSVLSRSNNTHNTAYILDNPTDNTEYSLSQTITASSNQSLTFLAKATGDLKGGAFNILDKIYEAQKYLREETEDCDQTFSDCQPFTVAPIVKVYWAPGLTPGVYFGSSDGISFYLNGTDKLFILGGINGDTENADMDHFDNSVIVHEYGHFIEDNFGRPDSPGGSHNGNSIIDPRLAWGEGWANFFQAAVLGDPRYRDTYGHVGCTGSNQQGLSGCYGITFDEDIDPDPSDSYLDKPQTAGEGNFREFSITRLLYEIAKPGGTSQFSEIWTVLRGPINGFYAISDRFKSIGRFHTIQQEIANAVDWSDPRDNHEMHTGDLSNYATPLVSCTPGTQAMAFRRASGDNGSFATSDQFRSNDFFAYPHPGGTLNLSLTWTGAIIADLDLYVYKEGYTYGSSSSLAALSDTTSTATSGSESIMVSLPAGNYMINVMAYTGLLASANPPTYLYTANTTYNTSYTLKVNGSAVCPNP